MNNSVVDPRARFEALVSALLDASACDSDIERTCRDNWPTDPGSWCGGCQILAVGDAWRQSQASLAGHAEEIARLTAAVEFWKVNAARQSAACAKAEAERDALRAALAGMVGVSTREELEQMEAVIRSQPAPAEDKAVAINAIHALLRTLPALTSPPTPQEPA